MADVILKNITKIYDKKKVIDDVSIEIKDKEFLVLVGSSGCGKSTILRMIAGLENITSGDIVIGGKNVNNVPPKDRDIAFVFQSYALYPHMNVYENMAFPLKMHGYKKDYIDEKVKKTAEFLDLSELLNRKPKELSGGQRQRVALGRAIVREPKVFLMDEPLSNLDAKLRAKTRGEIKKLHQDLKTTFIYVTHDQTEALTMGDRIAVINEGKIQQIGTPEEIYNLPENVFVGGFLGNPPMNFINVKIENNVISINNSQFEFNEEQKNLLNGRNEVIIGIRAEKFGKGNFTFNSEPKLIEVLGSKKIVYFDAEGSYCAADFPADFTISTETSASFTFDTADILFFDKITNKRIK